MRAHLKKRFENRDSQIFRLPAPISRFLEDIAYPPGGDTYYGERASNYDVARESQEWRANERAALSEILDTIVDAKSVLDLPCGTGIFFDIYARHSLDVTGLDSSEEMLALARARAEKEGMESALFASDGRNRLPFQDNQFDLTVCLRYLQGIVPWGSVPAIIGELSRVTKGYLLLELDWRPDSQPRNLPGKRSTMRDRFYRNEVIEMLKSNRLEVVREYRPLKPESNSQSIFVCSIQTERGREDSSKV